MKFIAVLLVFVILALIVISFIEETSIAAINPGLACAERWAGAPVQTRWRHNLGCQVSRDGDVWWPENAVKVNLWGK